MLEMLEPWDTCQGEIQTRYGSSPKAINVLYSAELEGVDMKSHPISSLTSGKDAQNLEFALLDLVLL